MCRLTSFVAVAALSAAVLAADPPPNPDFTFAPSLPKNSAHDWNLGPTGARGWVHSYRGETTQARQILITEVDAGSPADGVLQANDVILGVDGRNFTTDARIAFAKAITTAEAKDGRLNVIRWRDDDTETGSTQSVELPLQALGAYSETAPYNCPKSRRILENGCRLIADQLQKQSRRGGFSISRCLNAMALLASGQPQYRDLVKAEAQRASQFEVRENDLHSWSSGWVTMFLAEYALATGDDSVLPALDRLSVEIAQGQSNVGTWGHRFAYKHNGILRGYGAMNQVGLTLTTALILARDAGVQHPDVDRAIERSRRFLRAWVGRGAIPYGDHHPWLKMHDDNGKCSAGAVLFDAFNDSEATSFYSRMATASYGIERETGHTGNFFNMLWSLPGISRSGPHATGQWIQESAWLLDLARRWDGSFTYNGKPAATGGEHSYRNWDCTGAYLLGYALSNRQIRLTGSRKSSAAQLTAEQAKSIIDDGRGWMPIDGAASYKNRTVPELMQALSNWSPVVRQRAAEALAKSQNASVTDLIALAGSSDVNAQLGACAALEELRRKAAPAVPALRELLSSDDLWVRVQAAEALASIGDPARSAVPDLLKLVGTDLSDDDPRAIQQRYVAFALFYPGRALKVPGLISRSLGDVDRELLYSAMRAALKNEDGRVRDAVGSTYGLLSDDEIQPLLPVIHQAVVEQSPSGVMFSDGIRLRGLQLLAKHRIAEGLPLCLSLIEPDRWGSDRRLEGCLKALEIYAGSAKKLLPELRELEKTTREPKARGHKHHGRLVKVIAKIESSPKAPVVSLSRG